MSPSKTEKPREIAVGDEQAVGKKSESVGKAVGKWPHLSTSPYPHVPLGSDWSEGLVHRCSDYFSCSPFFFELANQFGLYCRHGLLLFLFG